MKTNAHWSDWIIIAAVSPFALCGMVGWGIGHVIGTLMRDKDST